MNIRDILARSPLMPILTVSPQEHENLEGTLIPLTKSLMAGGMTILEITLRTPSAYNAIRVIRKAFPNLIIGAGTVVDSDRLGAAVDAGADFCVTPGLTPKLAESLLSSDTPCMPGVATPSEVMTAREYGFEIQKLFPASVLNGPKMLKAVHSVFPELIFCPTGGIDGDTMKAYLQLPNVISIGGSWMLPPEARQNKRWGEVQTLAQMSLRKAKSILAERDSAS